MSNQHIEAWWSQLRKSCCDWWIRYFKDLQDRGIFCDDVMHVQCLKFCYMSIIQEEIHQTAKHWNTHVIRPSTNAESPSARPDSLYFIPEITETMNYIAKVDSEDTEVANEMCCN